MQQYGRVASGFTESESRLIVAAGGGQQQNRCFSLTYVPFLPRAELPCSRETRADSGRDGSVPCGAYLHFSAHCCAPATWRQVVDFYHVSRDLGDFVHNSKQPLSAPVSVTRRSCISPMNIIVIFQSVDLTDKYTIKPCTFLVSFGPHPELFLSQGPSDCLHDVRR